MGYMKNLDIRIRSGGDDAIAAACELLPRWIPVGERLPEDGASVLGWRPGDPVFECQWHDASSGGGIDREAGWFCYPEPIDPPTHWMPLPEPPAA